jgi:hypothetical protein
VTVVGLAATLVILSWLLFVAREYPSRIDSYRVVDERTIVVQVVAPPRGWTWVDEVVESSSAVKVSVRSFDLLPGPGTAYAISLELTVQLDEPLGDRLVEDGDGRPVPRPNCTDNACSPRPSA